MPALCSAIVTLASRVRMPQCRQLRPALSHLSVCWTSSAQIQHRKYVPRRAMMYVPGSDEKKLKKIPSLQADCVVMDCEDGVAINRKEEARTTICQQLDTIDFGEKDCAVRINSADSGLGEDDLNAVLKAHKLPQTLMMPKVQEPGHLDWFSEKLSASIKGRTLTDKFNLVIFVESAIGLLNLRDTCQRGKELSQSAPFHLDGIVFGSDDMLADLGATRTKNATELMYARQKTVLTAKAFGLQAIDLVHIDFKDLQGLREQSAEGAKMGFTGKQVIHPSQIHIVQEEFSPSWEKIQWAYDLIKAFEDHQKSGKGAFTFRGSMIDMPLVLQAKNIVALAQAVKPDKT